jgi:hypothetical protein
MTNLNTTAINLLDTLIRYGCAAAFGPQQEKAARKLEELGWADVERNTTHGADVLLLTLRLGGTARLVVARATTEA